MIQYSSQLRKLRPRKGELTTWRPQNKLVPSDFFLLKPDLFLLSTTVLLCLDQKAERGNGSYFSQDEGLEIQ